jgi:arylsulfatase A-like enzyme
VLRSAALVALCVALLTLPSCSRPTPPNIVLVVVDTLRADRLGAYGSVTGLTPYLDQLAARGTVFANTWAPSSWTCPSVASLFTSRYPSQHHVATFDSVLADEEVSLAEALEPRDYDSAGFSANFRLTRALGYAQGFYEWQADWRSGKIRGSYLRSEVATWLAKKPHMPALLYLQYMEPHAPYEPPEPFRSKFQRNPQGALDSEVVNDKVLNWQHTTPQEVRFLSSLYSAEVASVDDELRKMMELLEKHGFLSNTIIVITADHGEEFNEHQVMGHGTTLYEDARHAGAVVPVVTSHREQAATGRVGYPSRTQICEKTSVSSLSLKRTEASRRSRSRSSSSCSTPAVEAWSGFSHRAFSSAKKPSQCFVQSAQTSVPKEDHFIFLPQVVQVRITDSSNHPNSSGCCRFGQAKRPKRFVQA